MPEKIFICFQWLICSVAVTTFSLLQFIFCSNILTLFFSQNEALFLVRKMKCLFVYKKMMPHDISRNYYLLRMSDTLIFIIIFIKAYVSCSAFTQQPAIIPYVALLDTFLLNSYVYMVYDRQSCVIAVHAAFNVHHTFKEDVLDFIWNATCFLHCLFSFIYWLHEHNNSNCTYQP